MTIDTGKMFGVLRLPGDEGTPAMASMRWDAAIEAIVRPARRYG
jgi:hypothetical protein